MQKPQQTILDKKFWIKNLEKILKNIFERFVWYFLLFVGILQKNLIIFLRVKIFLFFFADNSFDSALIGKYN